MRQIIQVILVTMAWSSPGFWAASAVPPAVEQAQDTGQALMLWVVVAGGLLIFLVAIVLVSVSRRASRLPKPETPSAELDAWKSAADRLEPPLPPEQP
jgi:hypothetical protein